MPHHPLAFQPFGEKVIRDPTVGDVVNWMCRLAYQAQTDLEIRRLAERIVGGVQSGDYTSEAIAIYRFCSPPNIRYTRDPAFVELTRWPRETLTSRCGDCDDVATLIAALCMAIGHRCSFVLAGFRGDGVPSHVFTRVDTNKGPIALDPVAGTDTKKMLGEMTSWNAVRCDVGVPEGLARSSRKFNGWAGWR